ncbi:MAG: YnbE family lipoprotein [Sphingomonas sp.]
MKHTGLTIRRGSTTNAVMKGKAMVKRTMLAGAMLLPALTGGCVSVSAPDKPIVINLNINITQQVVYRLDNQAKELIQGNSSIF